MSTTQSYPALVSHDPNPSSVWKLENVTILRAPGDRQVKGRLLATGICHSDIVVGSIPGGAMPGISYPRILGDEGAGIVEAVGPGVTAAQVGDRVLLSLQLLQRLRLVSQRPTAVLSELDGSQCPRQAGPV